MSENHSDSSKLSRRTFLKWTGALSVPVIGGGLFTVNNLKKEDAIKTVKSANKPEKIIPTCSTFDCGGKCMVKAHVKGFMKQRAAVSRLRATQCPIM